MTTTNFMQESQWQQRIHEALAKYTTADVVVEVRSTLEGWMWEKVYPEKAASMMSITNEDIHALVEVIDDNEHQANPEALTLAQSKGIYEYLEWMPYPDNARDPEDWTIAYLKALCGEELPPSTPRTPWGQEPWNRIVADITQASIDNAAALISRHDLQAQVLRMCGKLRQEE
jgi:hypothetical protein